MCVCARVCKPAVLFPPDQASLQHSAAAQENSSRSITAVNVGCWLTIGLVLSRASMCHRPLTRPHASLTAVISVGSPPAHRERQEIELHTLINWMTVYLVELYWSVMHHLTGFVILSYAALDSSRALPRRSCAQAEDDSGPCGQQLHALTSGGVRWVKWMFF